MKTTYLFILLLGWINMSAQVGIGTTHPDESAQLDISSGNKGLLIPRVSLNDVTDTSLDGTNNAIEGLTIYNTNDNVTGGNGKGFYYFDGTHWTKLVPQSDNVAVIAIDTNQYYYTGTIGQDVPGYDAALEPTFFNKNGRLQVKLIIRYSSIQGTVNFQLRAHDDNTESYPVTNTDFGVYAHTQSGGVATSDWKNWDAGTHAYEIHLYSWISSGNSGDHATIESAYLLVRSQ